MVNYQKYMFDDFVVLNNDKKDVCPDNEPLQEIVTEEILEINNVEAEETKEENYEEIIEPEVLVEENIPSFEEEVLPVSQSYNYIEETKPEENIVTYTEEELKEALSQAEEVAYNKGLAEAKSSLEETQNILLEDIKNQLTTIYASLEEKKSDLEVSALNFAVSLVEKLMPTMEKSRAESEVKNFLAENFANFSSQETLSFSFNPDMLSHVSDSIRRLAEQNDFEGKISVHKDISLGLSDCRVEWKSGGVERKVSSTIDKVKSLINFGKKERENGE